MTQPLPPELEELEARYQDVYRQYTDGALSYDDAVGAINNMTTVDGSGAIWRVNTEQDGFLRATPGGQFTPTDPQFFAPHTYPGAQAQPTPGPASGNPFGPPPGQAPWGGNDPSAGAPYSDPTSNPFIDPTSQPPGGYPPNSGYGAEPQPGGPWGPESNPPGGPYAANGGNPFASGAGAGQQPWNTQYDQAGGLMTAPSGGSKGGIGAIVGRVSNLPPRTKIVGAVAAVAVLFVIFLVLRGGGAETPADGGVPVGPVPTETAPAPDGTEQPPSPEPSQTEPVEPTVGDLPKADDAANAISTLSNGMRDMILTLLPAGQNVNKALLVRNAVVFSGYQRAGLNVTAGAPTVTKDNTVAQIWEVVDVSENNRVIGEIRVTWTLDNGVWKLAELPKQFPLFS